MSQPSGHRFVKGQNSSNQLQMGATDADSVATRNDYLSAEPALAANAAVIPFLLDRKEEGGSELWVECGTEKPSSMDKHDFPAISTPRAIILVALVMISSVLQVSTGIGVAINTSAIGNDLGIPAGELQWIGSSSALATACTLLVLGRLADMYGHKAVFIIGCSAGSALLLGMGFAKDKYQLFVLRALSGCAFAAVTPAAMGILGSTFPEGPAKSRAFATLGAGAPVGTAVGLVLAGITTQYVRTGWRTYFYIAAGLSALVAFGAAFLAPGPIAPRLAPGQSLKSLDWLGILLSAAGLFFISFSLGYGESASNGWTTSYVVAFLCIGPSLIGMFIYWQYYLENHLHRQPLMRLGMWKNGKFSALMLIVLALSGGFSSLIFWMTLYWQNYEGRSLIQTTLRFLPLCVVGVITNMIGSACVAIVSGQMMLLTGAIATAIAALLFALPPPSYIYWACQFPACCLCVLGADLMFLTSMLYLSKISNSGEQAQIGGVFSTATQLGGTLVLAISTIVSDHVADSKALQLGLEIHSGKVQTSLIPKEALLKGYRAAFWTCCAFASLAALLIIVGLRGMGPVGRSRTAHSENITSAETKQP